MAGRQSRAQQLAPAFLMVASALACGEVSSDEVENDSTTAGNAGVTSNPPSPGGAFGGIGEVSVNPPYVGTGGAGGVNMPVTSGAGGIEPGTSGTGGSSAVSGAGGVGTGGFSNPPILFLPCPVALPVDDSSCATGHLFQRYTPMCAYEIDGCGSTQAVCDAQTVTWQVEACDGGASNSGGVGGAGGAE